MPLPGVLELIQVDRWVVRLVLLYMFARYVPKKLMFVCSRGRIKPLLKVYKVLELNILGRKYLNSLNSLGIWVASAPQSCVVR